MAGGSACVASTPEPPSSSPASASASTCQRCMTTGSTNAATPACGGPGSLRLSQGIGSIDTVASQHFSKVSCLPPVNAASRPSCGGDLARTQSRLYPGVSYPGVSAARRRRTQRCDMGSGVRPGAAAALRCHVIRSSGSDHPAAMIASNSARSRSSSRTSPRNDISVKLNCVDICGPIKPAYASMSW